jgi:Histone-like transcription factor (CBF/NF-Y) and archaeal histone
MTSGAEPASLSFPAAVVQRIASENLPETAVLAPDTVALLSVCSADFLRLLSSEASQLAGKKIIQPATVASALTKLGFTAYADELQEDEAEQPKKQVSTSPIAFILQCISVASLTLHSLCHL